MQKLLKIYLFLLAAVLMACNGTRLDKVFKPASPYEQYVRDISTSVLKESAMVKDWIQSGERVLLDSTSVELPYQELSYFDPKEANAMGLRFEVREGQQLVVRLTPVSQPDARFFLDLYEVRGDGSLVRKASADTGQLLEERIGRTGIYMLRVQPELLRGGVFELSMSYQASLAFPIPGKNSRNIASFYGDPRDGGGRRHEGVDVFAPKGTPVVAVMNGRVSRVGTNRLGGKTVSVTGGGYSYYYAHLDSQLVHVGRAVREGDTLGLVGNTGNAITTAPHLHFGIYSMGRGSVDPLFFFRNPSPIAAMDLTDSLRIGQVGRIKGNAANIRISPSTNSRVLTQLSRRSILQIEGKSGNWYRIKLPQQQTGYISVPLVELAENPLGTLTIAEDDFFKKDWSQPVYNHEIESGEAELLGEFDSFNFIRTTQGRLLWHQHKE
jgi:peptidoglycan LD-endopeptidase LytH